MSTGSDIAVIGAGVFGLCAAWAALGRGLSVTVHEATAPGAGASGGLVGALSPHMPEKWNPKKAFQFDCLIGAEAFWRGIEAVSNSATGYGRVGRILPLHSERARTLAEERMLAVPDLWQGRAQWQVLDAAEGVAPATHGYVHESLSARIFPRAATAALAEAVRRRGGHFAGSATPETAQGRKVIVAAGHEAARLAGLKNFGAGVKGQAALLDARLPDDFPVVFDDGTYIIGHAGGVAIGSTSETEWRDMAPDARLDPVIATARALVPALAGAPVIERWCGIRPRARLPDPALGPVSGNVWLMTGGFKIGFALGPRLGEAIVAMILGEDPRLPQSFHLSEQLAR